MVFPKAGSPAVSLRKKLQNLKGDSWSLGQGWDEDNCFLWPVPPKAVLLSVPPNAFVEHCWVYVGKRVDGYSSFLHIWKDSGSTSRRFGVGGALEISCAFTSRVFHIHYLAQLLAIAAVGVVVVEGGGLRLLFETLRAHGHHLFGGENQRVISFPPNASWRHGGEAHVSRTRDLFLFLTTPSMS